MMTFKKVSFSCCNILRLTLLLQVFVVPLSKRGMSAYAADAVQTAVPSLPAEAPLQRNLSIRTSEVFDSRKLRLYAIVDERDAENRYLLNTLDARAFRLHGEDPNEPLIEAKSLSTFASFSPSPRRETAIVYESSDALQESQMDSLRRALATFLGGFRSDFLSIRISNAEVEKRLAWIAPGQSENPRAVQKSILESENLKGKSGLTAGVCAVAKEFASDVPEKNGTQRSLVLLSSQLSSSADGDRRKFANCLTDLEKRGFRIFWIYLNEQKKNPQNQTETLLNGISEKSKGFSARWNLGSDPTATLNNLKSYLDDEYILEFDLTDHHPYSARVTLQLSANYHGNILHSEKMVAEGLFARPRPEELARIALARELAHRKELQTVYFICAVVVSSGALIWFQLRRNSKGCDTCGFRVAKGYQDCPFRSEKSYGRLSIVQGPGLGYEFPLFSGENTFGRGPRNSIRLKGKGVSLRHGMVTITKRKALLAPSKGNETRVNGVIATEPRLLSSGSFLRIGEVVCRVDFKEVT
ncbi:FHA domain-containing protein [bacterium]|nr:FHA domain-containing protein [bacterium]